MRFLVIGAGSAGRIHCSVLRHSGHEVVVWDKDLRAAHQAAHDFGVEVAENGLGEPHDVAVVATPPRTHYALVSELAERGSVVVCEKPLCLWAEDAWHLAEEAVVRGWRVYVAESEAYGSGEMDLEAMRERIVSGEFGERVSWWIRGMTTYRPQPWSLALEHGGGAFMEGGIHIFTVARVLFGESVDWCGRFHRHFNADGPDTGTAIVDYETGHQLVLQLGWGTGGCFDGECTPLYATSGFVGGKKQLAWWPPDDHEAMWQRLYHCIETGEPPVVSLADAAGAVADVWLCYKAGGITLPEEG